MFENQTISFMKDTPHRIRHQLMSQLLPRKALIEYYGPLLRAPSIEWDPWIVIPTQNEDILKPNIKDVLKDMNIHTPHKLRGFTFDPTPHLRNIFNTNKHSRHTCNPT